MAGGESSKGKESVAPFVKICINSQDGLHCYYKVSRNADIKKIFRSYCKEKNVEFEYVNFVYNGSRLSTGGTIDELGMTDGDEIDAMVSHTGGGPSN